MRGASISHQGGVSRLNRNCSSSTRSLREVPNFDLRTMPVLARHSVVTPVAPHNGASPDQIAIL